VSVAATVYFDGLHERLERYFAKFRFDPNKQTVNWLRGFLALRHLNERFASELRQYDSIKAI